VKEGGGEASLYIGKCSVEGSWLRQTILLRLLSLSYCTCDDTVCYRLIIIVDVVAISVISISVYLLNTAIMFNEERN